MGHTLAPYLFQRFSEAVLDEVSLSLNIDGIAYLDDCLLHFASGTDRENCGGHDRSYGHHHQRTKVSSITHDTPAVSGF